MSTQLAESFWRKYEFNSLAPGWFEFNFRKVIFKLTLVNGGWRISYKIALRWIPQDFTDDKSTLVQVMAWCRQATSPYLSECWPRSMSPNGVTRPQWVSMYLHFISFLYNEIFQVDEILNKDNDIPILRGQYCSTRWPGDIWSQGISSCGIDLVLPEYSAFSIRRVNSWRTNLPCEISRPFLDIGYCYCLIEKLEFTENQGETQNKIWFCSASTGHEQTLWWSKQGWF